MVRNDLVVRPTRGIVATTRVVNEEIHLIRRRGSLARVSRNRVPFGLRIKVFLNRHRQATRVPRYHQVVLARVVQITPIIRVRVLLVQARLIGQAFNRVRVVIAAIGIARFRTCLDRSMVGQRAIFFDCLGQVGRERHTSMPRESRIGATTTRVHVDRVSTSVEGLLALSNDRSANMNFLGDLYQRVRFQLPSMRISLRVVGLTVRSLSNDVIITTITVYPRAIRR